MKKTSIHIVLLTYNRSNYLRYSIDSVLNQTFKNFSFTVINNGSTDNTQTILNEYQDPRLNVINYSKNSRENINYAFKCLNSEFLTIIHDDDILHENFLNYQLKILLADKTLNALGCSVSIIDSNNSIINKVRPILFRTKYWNKNEFISTYLFKGDIIPCPTLIYRSSILKKHHLKFETKAGPAADLYLKIQLNLIEGKIGVSKKPLYYYRIHSNQDSEINRTLLEYKVQPYIISLLKENNLNNLSAKYNNASNGIILNILIYNFLTKNINYRDLKKELKSLKKFNFKPLNYLSFYWASIAILRRIKKYLHE